MKNKKSLGQHWLKNRLILDQIADAAVSTPDVQQCIEIGPGLGTLTSSLLRRFAKVIAIEFDADLAQKLPGSFPGKNLEVIHGDILTTDLAQLVNNQPYAVAGNIPYYITSPIISKLLATRPLPTKISLLMQKEVAVRIAAEPGTYSLLALTVQNLAEVELGPVVQAAEFTPPPKVDSQVLILTPLAEPQIAPACLTLAKRGFSSPRKKLAGVLADNQLSREQWRAIFANQDINLDCRAQDLLLWDWENLYNYIGQSKSSHSPADML